MAVTRSFFAPAVGYLAVAMAGCADDGAAAGASSSGSTMAEASTLTEAASASTQASFADDTTTADASTTGPPLQGRLTDAQRIAYLHYYAPVIFKEAHETDIDPGRDWITNFNFDRDGWSLSNNRAHWLSGLSAWVAGTGNLEWRVRPTLYTAAIEFTQDEQHSLVLLFHVYHAEQGLSELEETLPEAASIHDWERVEIRIDELTAEPGPNNEVRYVVITEHSNHVVRLGTDPELNFMSTDSGMHPMIFQAEQTDPLGVGYGELRFIVDSFDAVMARPTAELNVGGTTQVQAYSYVFVTEGDEDAATELMALPLNSCTAFDLASRSNARVATDDVPRIEYELQDLADVFESHWDDGISNAHWTEPRVDIELEEALLGEDGSDEVPAGLQTFYAQARDDLDDLEHRRGYPRKHWFWGAYAAGAEGEYSEAFEDEARCDANGRPDCADAYWHQHDYFVHDGTGGDGTLVGEAGGWLPAGWHTAEGGGFDGRWVQLFADERVDPCG